LAGEEPNEAGETANSVSELATVSVFVLSRYRSVSTRILLLTFSLKTPPAEKRRMAYR